ncbi:recombinase family protein [Streptomyces sp. NPDC020607]|uniref:recombinase family protein n=1 Tax=Streptomyces sp. NPDC020607 TaxID=3365082 RepID=UPI003791A72E
MKQAYHRIVNLGWSCAQIARDWNKRGILTPRNYQNSENLRLGREGVSTKIDPGITWDSHLVRDILRRPTLMGYATQNGKVRMRDGMPVIWAQPLLSASEFKKLQKALDALAHGTRGPMVGNPLTGTIYHWCGAPMHSSMARTKRMKKGVEKLYEYHYLRCRTIGQAAAGKGERCSDVPTLFPVNYVKQLISGLLLDELGDVMVTTKTFVPGVDNTEEIETLEQGINNLSASLASVPAGSMAQVSILETMASYEKNLKALESQAVVPEHWKVESTGRMFRDEWEGDMDWEARSDLLERTGARLYLGGPREAPYMDLYAPRLLTQDMLNAPEGDDLEPGWLAKWHREVESRHSEFARKPNEQ